MGLQEGITVRDHVYIGELDYYSFYYEEGKGAMSITLTTLSGDPDLFVSTHQQRPAPQPGNYSWLSTRFGGEILTIDPSSDLNACVNCVYYIAVLGSKESEYAITVSFKESINVLQDGVLAEGHTAMLAWRYFVFPNHMGDTIDITITLTSYSGNAVR
jgi:hypothetical protein